MGLVPGSSSSICVMHRAIRSFQLPAASCFAAASYPWAFDRRSSAAAEQPQLRVLVTGFHDWRGLGGNPNLWRCRDNPSCRLLLGPPSSAPPVQRNGELPQILRKELPLVNFCFQTLTVTWGTCNSIDLLAYDVVIHIGLGVYDSHSKILIEDGAFNGRSGKDAAEREAGPTIEMGSPQVCSHEGMSKIVQTLHGRRLYGHDVEAAPARVSNNYICNETHWRALKALHASEQEPSSSSLRGCFFVHIPTPAKASFKNDHARKAYEEQFCDLDDNTDYSQLARAVADVLKLLISSARPGV